MYELEFKDINHYLQVTVSGELNPATDVAIDADIRQECENRMKEFVLIDIRPMSTRLNGIENHLAARSIRERMGLGIRAIAIVDTIDFEEKSKMYELTATNRGARVKFFEGCEAAESWLLGFNN